MGDPRPRVKRLNGESRSVSGSLGSLCETVLPEIPGFDLGKLRKARRVEAVRRMWAGVVERPFLEHTNGVYVFMNEGRREMHVYVDDSIFAAELNARRELIKWECLAKFDEQIDDFFIYVSKGKYKSLHPFEDVISQDDAAPSVSQLDQADLDLVEHTASSIEDPRMRERFKEAMISDLKWKKSGK